MTTYWTSCLLPSTAKTFQIGATLTEMILLLFPELPQLIPLRKAEKRKIQTEFLEYVIIQLNVFIIILYYMQMLPVGLGFHGLTKVKAYQEVLT